MITKLNRVFKNVVFGRKKGAEIVVLVQDLSWKEKNSLLTYYRWGWKGFVKADKGSVPALPCTTNGLAQKRGKKETSPWSSSVMDNTSSYNVNK